MNERLFARLAELLVHGPVVLARVLEARGATPRKGGSKMLISAGNSEFSIGGGLAEARVLAAAQALLESGEAAQEVPIDLTGRPGAAGICGGSMRIHLQRWYGADDLARAKALSARLAAGLHAELAGPENAAEVASTVRPEPVEGQFSELLMPNARLLIIGGGHCALALYQLARYLEFDIWVYDARASCFADQQFSEATTRQGELSELLPAFTSERAVYAVLLNRDFASDVAALQVLVPLDPHFLGMMGSRKRIAEVRAALPGLDLQKLIAPVGLKIGAQTPHEIAVSILGQLIEVRAQQTS